MITRRMQIRRRLRSARTSALSEEERRMELREAEVRRARDRGEDVASEVTPASGGAGRSAEAHAGRAGVDNPH
jgi:hypothetical protein